MSASPCETVPAGAEADDCRCLCGSLLARVVDGHVELKCRRCKRTLVVPLTHAVAPSSAAGSGAGAREAG